ncbi:MAG TPA: SDR family NAD(P)-dependent oxidoreductase, partial [Ramlibacter sp.]|nr:SDR family NAD(P)-dependent oxidoreductase [Ramlibacter sp.]
MQGNALAGKVAVITGGGQGLGRAIVDEMAREGARIVVCDINPGTLEATRAELAARGTEVLAVNCNVSDRAAVDALFEQAGERFGTVDILVNNAGLVPSTPAE